MFLWALGCLSIFEPALLFSLDKCPGVEVLDHVVVLVLIFVKKLSVSLLLSFPPQPPKPHRIPVAISPPRGAASFLSTWGKIRLQVTGIIPLLIWGGQRGRISILLSTEASPTYITTSSAQRFPVLHILTNPCYFLPFDDSPSKVTCSFVVLICTLLMSKDIEHLFMCLLAICISFLIKCLYWSSA